MKQDESNAAETQLRTLVVGLGVTGLSCARFLARQGVPVAVNDSRDQPPGLDALEQCCPDLAIFTGRFDEQAFEAAERIVLSPGVSLKEPIIQQAIARGVEIIGDIDLFLQHAEAPIIAITGSNGKSTVTTLVGDMAQAAGVRVAVGGNLGTPVLELLDSNVELYVLELSSFQLELVHQLRAAAAVVLNISADHMDRYDSIDDYAAAKAVVYENASVSIVNLDDESAASLASSSRPVGFTLSTPPSKTDYGICGIENEQWLCRGAEKLLPVSELRVAGRHNHANVLAALALGEAVGLVLEPMLEAVRQFNGLVHRTQYVVERDGVRWYNDSKGTNIGACIAALDGLQSVGSGRTILIAGGDCKGADFTELRDTISNYVRTLILIGRDAPMIESVVGDAVSIVHATDMDDAVAKAASCASPGDRVVLSPACASFDMFDNYQHRGVVFMRAVQRLLS